MHSKSIQDFLTNPKVVDWRFPDKDGFCERTLDCKQLAVKEVLRWRKEKDLLPIFLSPFDCSHKDLQLRRSEPNLNLGWSLQTKHSIPKEKIISEIQHSISKNGYCLLFYKSFETTYSSYYKTFDIVHWSLIVNADEGKLTLIDEAGHPSYFQGHLGHVNFDNFQSNWLCDSNYGIGQVIKEESSNADWSSVCFELMRSSVENMTTHGGLENLKDFVDSLQETSPSIIVEYIETLEFDIHYFRRLRELWLLAVNRGIIPKPYVNPLWVEELFYLCKCWSLIMGVLMKWKRQPSKDYKKKLVDYVTQTYKNEERFFLAMKQSLGV
ncbi:hypothetical protein SAMN04488137_4656 [Fictibacillus solisalsi]|uniref:Butirosin biosynthesis protein H, N-terminal n=1 Tax=Fictibacillus solisalsi TaxID=459525 RepID=A0A1H0BT66_9BACL|nr:hypothetical protein [Fictibacillus solisalsi]SDN48777.1 hypothetical protein SAMN04488137_4656 [Fictibacillus solisalsi]